MSIPKHHQMVGVLVFVFLFAACDTVENSRPPIEPVTVNHALSQMASCDGYVAYAKKSAIQRMRAEIERNCLGMLENAESSDLGIFKTAYVDDVPASVNAGEDSAMDMNGSAEGHDFSETNTQEQGVDEGDLVKTDGEYIYTISGHDLVIVRIDETGTLTETGRLAFDGYPSELFLYGDKVALFSELAASDVPEEILLPNPPEYDMTYSDGEPKDVDLRATDVDAPDRDYGYNDGSYTAVSVVDVSDRTAPTMLRNVMYAGRYVTSRRVDGVIRAVLSSPLSALEVQTWVDVDYWDMSEGKAKARINAACDTLLEKNEAYINSLTLADLLPQKVDSLDDTAEPIAACSDIFGAETPAGTGLLSVLSLDLDHATEKSHDVAVVGREGQVYASPTALYLTTATDYVLSAWESGLWEKETSGIHKFDIATDPARAIYLGTGTVKGRMLNQFSLGEYEDHLRVATTTGSRWWGEDSTLDNHIFILKADAGKLVVTGSLNGIGEGEEVYAARFLGPRGFVVTFLQTDPLFTFDLSDPTDPKVVGEWLGPGYSTYLHPFGEDLLVAMGVDENRRTAVSLYDLSDFAHPALVERQPLVGVNYQTAALDEHKAFTFNGDTGDLFLPFYDRDEATGVLHYTISPSAIDLAGTLDMGGSISVEGPARRAMYNGETIIGVGACRMTSASMTNPASVISSIPIYKDACLFPTWYGYY